MKSVWNKTDATIKEIYSCMVRDFRSLSGHKCLVESEYLLKTDISSFREFEWPTLGNVDVLQFKAHWQLQNFLKRHRFQDDVYSDDALEAKSNDKFIATQMRLSCHGGMRAYVQPVLREARKICREILGKFDPDELALHCRIGKRATLGSPLHKAYIDCKLGDPDQFTCPTSLRSWFFQEYLAKDHQMRRIVARIFRVARKEGKDLPLDVNFLNLVNVPKSWKSFRGITPLTNIGLFYSYGLQECVTKRLDAVGLRIKRLQEKHRKLAKRYSKSGSHATADLSEASDSIRSVLLRQIMPQRWYSALAKTFVRQIIIGDVSYYTESVLPMGNAATFPVETLIFYCLIKAVGNLLRIKGVYSVYGDDLIYPCKIHRHVSAVFAELGLIMNADKTFASMSRFRESCGGDYYHGIDVRPCLAPEHDVDRLTGRKYEAWLYKIYNALKERWEEFQIPWTLRFIEAELAYCSGHIYQVPPSYPSFAGIKTRVASKAGILPFSVPVYRYDKCAGSFMITFKHLAESVPNRVVVCEEAYLWEWFKAKERSVLPPDLIRRDAAGQWLTKPFLQQYLRYSDVSRWFGIEECQVPSLVQKHTWFRKRLKSGMILTRYLPDGRVHCKVKAETNLHDKVSLVPNWA